MSFDYTIRTIGTWPGKRSPRPERSRFDSSYSQTLELLETELRHLSAKSIVFQVDVDESQLTIKGRLRAQARCNSSAFILSFQSKHGPLSYPCDKFSDWQDNLRAIALALQALRLVDRYGVTRNAEQYTGWKALPPPVATAESELAWLRSFVGNGSSAYAISDLIRIAEKKSHPDLGGNSDDFKRVQEAREVLIE